MAAIHHSEHSVWCVSILALPKAEGTSSAGAPADGTLASRWFFLRDLPALPKRHCPTGLTVPYNSCRIQDLSRTRWALQKQSRDFRQCFTQPDSHAEPPAKTGLRSGAPCLQFLV